MEPAGAAGGGSPEQGSFGFPTHRRQGASKPSHRRAASSPAIDHDFGRGGRSMYSSGPFGVLGESSNGLFSPRLAIGLGKGHRESASGDFTMSTEAGDTSFRSSVDSLFHRGGLESLRSDFLKQMDLGRRRISEDERERVSHHSGAESTDNVSVSQAGGGGNGGGTSSRAALSRSLGATASGGSTDNLDVSPGILIRHNSDRGVVSSSDAALRMLSGSGAPTSTVRRSPSAGASLESSAGSSVGVSSVLGGTAGSSAGVGVGPSGANAGGDANRGVAGRGPSNSHQNHHATSNGSVSRNGPAAGPSSTSRGAGSGGDRDRRSAGGAGGAGGYRSHTGGGGRPGGSSGGGGGQPWMSSGGSMDDGYSTFIYRDQHVSRGGGGSGVSTQSSPAPPGGVPMYAVQGDGYSSIPIQHTYAVNGESYAQGVVGHLPPHAQSQHGLSQMQSGGLDGSVGDQHLLGPQHLTSMGSPPHAPMPAPQHMYMSAQGTYVLAGGNAAASNGNTTSNGASGGSGGSGGGGAHLQSGGGGLQPPMMVYTHQHQGGNAPPPQSQPQQQQQQQQQPQQQQLVQPPQQQQQSQPSSTDPAAAAHAAAPPMYLPMPQGGYGYVPSHANHLQTSSGMPIYQMAGPALEGPSPAGGRPNGHGAGGGGGSSSSGGTNRPGSPPPPAPQPAPLAPGPQGFQVHYALTPQGIVPMVPIMPNGAGGFTNPALYPGLGGMYDDGRGGMGAIAGMDGMDKGRLSPPLPAGTPMHARFAGSPPPPHPHGHAQHPHAAIAAGMPPMHAPAWSVGAPGPHDSGSGYHDAGVYHDRGYGGPGGIPDGYRGGPGPRDVRMPRDTDPGKDVKDRRKRLDRESDMAALLEATRPALKDVLGKVYSMSRDQVGCRLLQQKLDECPDRPPDGDAGTEGGASGEEDAVSAIFEEALPDLPQMMIDPFGNYLFQKLFVKIDDHQRLLAVEAVTERMPEAAVNLHGTRCVQKVVELCRTDAQAAVIARSLGPSVVKLSLDPNGNHVVQRALQHMPAPRNDFVLEAITASLVQVAVHRHGCCVLQRCLDAAGPKLRIKLVDEVARNGLKLMQDPFGNYVVQYVLKTCSREETYMLCSAPLGHVASLSTQKFSSNVMEACLERALPEVQSKFVEELAQQGRIRELILDQYANYVVQRALTVANNEEGLKLVAAIRPHLHSMQSTSSGRRIAAKIIKRYPTVDLGEEILMLMSRG